MKRWGLVSALTFFPIAAILHHAIFFAPQCMLNPFGRDYFADVVWLWLRSDPSPWLGALIAIGVYFLGKRYRAVQLGALAFLLAFVPLSLWVWDIPMTGRIICGHLHDNRTAIRGRHLYLLGAAVWILIFMTLRRRQSTVEK
jgi:phosphatidylglycerophosphate synthase